MKNIKLKLLITIIIIGVSISSAAQNTGVTGSTNNFAGDNVDFASSAKILVAMSLTKDEDLRFGTIMVTGNAESTVILDPTDGGRTFGAGLAAGTDDTYENAATAAEFTVTGSPSNTYGVMLQNSTITVTNTQASTNIDDEEMIISALKLSFDGSSSEAVVGGTANISTLGASANSDHTGTSTFTLGGTLTVKALQAGGTYVNSTTNIFVDYN
jgi:hypothetical protein|tara:strand:+ start:16 stop:654 length:639 start_codon:yes stop_codon:yes gene_type:complete